MFGIEIRFTPSEVQFIVIMADTGSANQGVMSVLCGLICINPSAVCCVRRCPRPTAAMPDSVRLGPQDDLGLSVALRASASSSGKWVSSGPQSLHHPNQHLLKGQLPSGGTWREWGPPPAKQGCLGDLHPESTPGMSIWALPSRAHFRVLLDTSQLSSCFAVARGT